MKKSIMVLVALLYIMVGTTGCSKNDDLKISDYRYEGTIIYWDQHVDNDSLTIKVTAAPAESANRDWPHERDCISFPKKNLPQPTYAEGTAIAFRIITYQRIPAFMTYGPDSYSLYKGTIAPWNK